MDLNRAEWTVIISEDTQSDSSSVQSIVIEILIQYSVMLIIDEFGITNDFCDANDKYKTDIFRYFHAAGLSYYFTQKLFVTKLPVRDWQFCDSFLLINY